MNDMNALPVARSAFPSKRITLARSLVERLAALENVTIKIRMTLGRCHKPDRTVAVFVVVPAHQFCDPCAGREQGIERLQRISRPVLQGFEK
jgi:hypothetical protein